MCTMEPNLIWMVNNFNAGIVVKHLYTVRIDDDGAIAKNVEVVIKDCTAHVLQIW